jgi:hypothetical protein
MEKGVLLLFTKRISLKSWLLGYEGRNHSKLDASQIGKRSQLC